MMSYIKNNPEKSWKIFKRLTIGILIGMLIVGTVYFYFIPRHLRLLNMAAEMLDEGILVTNFPNEFVEGKTEIITIKIVYRIDKEILARETKSNLEFDSIPLSSEISIEVIDLSSEIDKNFEITSIGSKKQLINSDLLPTWEFIITPLKSGEYEIGIKPTLELINSVTSTSSVIDLEMITKQIKVEPSHGYRFRKFINSYWQWIITVLIIPIWGYFFTIIKKALKEKKR